MGKRAKILLGMAAGMVWAVGVILVGRTIGNPGSGTASGWIIPFLPGGIVLLLVIGRLAQRRFFDDQIIDGDAFVPNSGAEIDQRVLQNTIEQLVLVLCLWPFIGLALGQGVLLALGLSFGLTRIAFWVGYHISPPLRGFGFAAGFYPTVLSVLLALIIGSDIGLFSMK